MIVKVTGPADENVCAVELVDVVVVDLACVCVTGVGCLYFYNFTS